MLEKPV